MVVPAPTALRRCPRPPAETKVSVKNNITRVFFSHRATLFCRAIMSFAYSGVNMRGRTWSFSTLPKPNHSELSKRKTSAPERLESAGRSDIKQTLRETQNKLNKVFEDLIERKTEQQHKLKKSIKDLKTFISKTTKLQRYSKYHQS